MRVCETSDKSLSGCPPVRFPPCLMQSKNRSEFLSNVFFNKEFKTIWITFSFVLGSKWKVRSRCLILSADMQTESLFIAVCTCRGRWTCRARRRWDLCVCVKFKMTLFWEIISNPIISNPIKSDTILDGLGRLTLADFSAMLGASVQYSIIGCAASSAILLAVE